MADYTPFNAMLDPEKSGTLTGFLGGIMGNPTREQAAGGAQGMAVQAITQMIQQGKSPQEATLAFFQTPQGQDFFANAGPDGVTRLASAIQSTQAPPPTMTTLSPGSMAIQTDPRSGKEIGRFSNPQSFAPTIVKPGEQAIDRNGTKIAENTNPDLTNEQKNFNFFVGISRLPPEEIRKLAAAQIDPNAKNRDTAKEKAIDDMVERFGLDPRTAAALKAGTIMLKEITTEFGQGTGSFGIIDLTKPNEGFKIIKPLEGSNPPVPGSGLTDVQGTTPGTGSAAGALPAAKTGGRVDLTKGNKNFGDKASMFLGAGAVSHILGAASNVSEQLNTGNIIPEGAQATDRQNLINNLRSSITAMGQMGEGISVNKGTVESYMKLAPTGGFTETPYEAVQKGIRLYEKVTQEISAEQESLRNTGAPMEVRKAAAKRIEGWSRVLRDLPTQEQLLAMEKGLREGTAGAMDVASGVKSLTNAGGKFLTEAKRQAGDAAKTIDDATTDFSKMNAEQLIAIDPRTLDRGQQIKYRRRIDQLKKELSGGR